MPDDWVQYLKENYRIVCFNSATNGRFLCTIGVCYTSQQLRSELAASPQTRRDIHDGLSA